MNIDKIFGLPAHPLLMHIPVLGIPLCALWVLAVVIRPSFRQRTALPLAIFTIVIAVFTYLTAGAGEQLEKRVDKSALLERHAHLGDQTKTIVIIFGIVTIVYLLIDWIARRHTTNGASETPARGQSPWTYAIVVVGIIAVLMGGFASLWDVRTGHSGATATWSDVGPPATPADGGD